MSQRDGPWLRLSGCTTPGAGWLWQELLVLEGREAFVPAGSGLPFPLPTALPEVEGRIPDRLVGGWNTTWSLSGPLPWPS